MIIYVMKVEIVSLPDFAVKKKIEIVIKKYELIIPDQIYGADEFDDFDFEQPKAKYLYDNNTYLDLKRFIASTEGIPLEYQHIESWVSGEWISKYYFYEPKDKSIKHLTYPIDIRNLDQESNVGGIPVDLNLASNRENYIIRDMSFKKIKSDKIRVYDLRDVLSLSDVSHFTSKDKDNQITFYTGFVEKFFPMVLFEDFYKQHLWDSFSTAVHSKILAMKELSSKKKKTWPAPSINSVKIKYNHSVKNDLHILKIYNSIDLEHFDKIEAYIPKSNKFLMKVLKNDLTAELSESETKRGYIKLFFEGQYIKVFENNDIEAVISEKESSKVKLLNIYKAKLTLVSEKLPVIETESAKQHSFVTNMTCSIDYPVTSNTAILKKLKTLVSNYERTEEYKISVALSFKENIVMYTNRSFISTTNNEYEALKSYIAGNKVMLTSVSSIHIIPRVSDFRVEFNNIPINEIDARTGFIGIIMSEASGASRKEEKVKEHSKIRILKQSDPILFDTKDQKYSRVCQSRSQPVIVTKSKPGAVKFWNFSKGEVQYYSCDSKSYPHLKFITGQHPKGYCLPCCKKKEVENSAQYKEKHIKCMETYSYDKKAKVATSRYISLYSCKIELESNKLMKLSNTMSKMFEKNTYILGVAPFVSTITNYTLTCLSLAVFNNYNQQADVIVQMSDIISNDPSIFYSLVEGSLVMYFDSPKEFTEFLIGLTDIQIVPKWVDFIDWETVFAELAEYIDVGITHIIEEDNGSVTDSQIYLSPCSKKFKKHIILLNRKKSIRYPIVTMDINDYYINGVLNILHAEVKSYEIKVSKETPIMSFVNDMNQVFAQCLETEHGKILRTVDYFHALKSTCPTSKSIEDYVDRNNLQQSSIENYTKVNKWIKMRNMLIAVDDSYLYFIKFKEGKKYDEYSLKDLTVPSPKEIKQSLYFTNMYNLLLLHVHNQMTKMTNKKIRNQIPKYIKNPEMLKKIIPEKDLQKISYKYKLTGNLDFLELDRFEFDSSENFNIQEFVEIGDPNFDLPMDGNLGVCTHTEYYCNKKKFILQEEQYLKILEKDLANPYKMKYIKEYNEISGSELYIQEYKNSRTIIYNGF